ncbi:MAG TPA: AAA family ATPase [Candidatus Saccharimonadales bacterium]|nr:AAA family ATPase [Candidatus Saccharimonadales bacterium]
MSTLVPQTSRRTLGIVLVSVDKRAAAGLREIVDSMPGFEITGELDNWAGTDSALLQELQQRQPDVCVIDFDHNREGSVARAEQIKNAMPTTAVFAFSSDSHPERIIEAMRSGCSEYLLKPLSRDRVVEALIKHEQKKRERGGPQPKRGKVYAFVGVKGGTGVTTLATHVGTFAAQSGIKTLLIDQHPDLGDVSVYLSLGKHQYHFFELVHNIHRLDSELLQGFITKHSSGLHVLAAPDSFGAGTKASETALESTLDFLREEYDLVLIDCPPGLNAYNVGAIDRADAVYLIASPELPSIRNLVRYLEHLKRFNCPQEKTRVIINRYDKRAAIREEQIEKTIRMPIAFLVPNSYAEVVNAINSGTPISYNAKTDLAVTFRKWIDTLVVKSVQSVGKQEPKRLFGILGL